MTSSVYRSGQTGRVTIPGKQYKRRQTNPNPIGRRQLPGLHPKRKVAARPVVQGYNGAPECAAGWQTAGSG